MTRERAEDPAPLPEEAEGLPGRLAATTTPVGAPTRRRVGALDGLRFVAAAAVLFQHGVEQQGALGQKIVAALSPGVFGVVLFFLISGYVIPMSAGKTFDLRRFVIRRVLRIYPLVLVAFAIAALLSQLTAWPSLANARSASTEGWIANLLLIQDYIGITAIHGVTWTLSLEFFWYALFAGLTLWKGKRFAEPLLIGLPLVLLAMGVLSWVIDHRLPLARPGVATVLIFQFMGTWNEFLYAGVLVQNPDLRTLQPAIFGMVGRYSTNWPALTAALTLSVLPILIVYVFMQRQFVAGLTAGAVKQ